MKLCENNIIFIYGASNKCQRLVKKLNQSRFHIEAIIDKNYKNINIPNCKVVGVEKAIEIIREISNKEKIVIIIALNDGLKHDKIAELFLDIGVEYIVFIPIYMNITQSDKSLYRLCYYEIVENGFMESEIPSCRGKVLNSNCHIINDKYKNHISLWINVECLFYNDNIMNKVMSVTECESYKSLFKNIRRKTKSLCAYKSYLDFQKIYNEENQKKMIANRRVLYECYQSKLKYEPSFFVDSPSVVEYQDDKLIVIDGNHRLHYLYQQGYDYVPVIMSKEDFKRYTRLKD